MILLGCWVVCLVVRNLFYGVVGLVWCVDRVMLVLMCVWL